MSDKLNELENILPVRQDLQLAIDDCLEMRRACSSAAGELLGLTAHHPLGETLGAEVREGVEFLEWLQRDNFIFLGYGYLKGNRPRARRGVPERALGLMLAQLAHELRDNPVPLSNPPDEVSLALAKFPLITVSESLNESRFHRPARLHRIVIKQLSAELEVVGAHIVLGLFTSSALRTPLKDVPILRQRLQKILDLDQAIRGSHDYTRIVSIADSMPREQLFWTPPAELHRDIRMLMNMGEGDFRVAVRRTPTDDLQVLVAMPTHRYSANTRPAVEKVLLAGFRASEADYHLAFDEESMQARLHFRLRRPATPGALSAAALETLLFEASRSWHEALEARLVASRGVHHGHALATAFEWAFGEGYISDNSPDMALHDIGYLRERSQDGAAWRATVFHLAEESVLRLYHAQDALILSDVLPMLESLGLRVLTQSSYPVRFWHERQEQHATITVFRVQDRRSGGGVAEDEGRLISDLLAMLEGRPEGEPVLDKVRRHRELERLGKDRLTHRPASQAGPHRWQPRHSQPAPLRRNVAAR